MLNSKLRMVLAGLLPVGVVAGLFGLGIVRLDYQAEAQLSFKGQTKTVIGHGITPSQAVRAAEAEATNLSKKSVNGKKAELRKKITLLKNRQTSLASRVTNIAGAQQAALKGSRQPWTPEMAKRLEQARGRHRVLKEGWPTHTDIPVLAQQIQSLEAIQRGSTKVDRARVSDLSKQIVEARIESSLLGGKIRAAEAVEKALKSDWTVVKSAAQPRWPANVPGWPIAAGAFAASCLLSYFIVRTRQTKEDEDYVIPVIPEAISKPEPIVAEPASTPKITLEMATEESAPLPDDPMTRKAAALYQRWLDVVGLVYAPGPEAPKDIYAGTEPLLGETAEFLEKGNDVMTRYLARVVIPGDMHAHVARTVLMALIGAFEAGATKAQQQGMTYAALFHDLAVVPRPAETAQDIGSEVGRLSAVVLRKIPGIPESLLQTVEHILIAMDEYPMDTWQNVPRSQDMESFAKLLGHIDRFDKVLQKQKNRLASRRLKSA